MHACYRNMAGGPERACELFGGARSEANSEMVYAPGLWRTIFDTLGPVAEWKRVPARFY